MSNPAADDIPTGRGTGIRTSGRFESAEIEVDLSQTEHDADLRAEFQRPRTRYFDDTARTVVSENDSPDIPFRYSLNPYRGCVHGCSYCYARPSHEYLGLSPGLDFETKIFVKRNAAELFRRWMCRRGYQVAPVTMSGITDCYQPVERALGITRQCLQTAADAGQPISVITKNGLIRNDLDLLASMAERRLVRVALSITSLDQSLTRILEPRTSAPDTRLQTIRELATRGIPVHVMVAPVIPGLNDSEIPGILEASAAAGAGSCSYILLRLPLSVQDIFVDWLRRRRPAEADKVVSRLTSTRDGQLNDTEFERRMRGTGPLADQIASLFQVCSRRLGLDQPPPALSTDQFRVPDGQRRLF